MSRIAITTYTLTCAAGTGMDAIRNSFSKGQTGLSNESWYDCSLDTWLGRVKQLDDQPEQLAPEWHSRNNRLAKLGAEQDGFTAAVEQAKAKNAHDK